MKAATGGSCWESGSWWGSDEHRLACGGLRQPWCRWWVRRRWWWWMTICGMTDRARTGWDGQEWERVGDTERDTERDTAGRSQGDRERKRRDDVHTRAQVVGAVVGLRMRRRGRAGQWATPCLGWVVSDGSMNDRSKATQRRAESNAEGGCVSRRVDPRWSRRQDKRWVFPNGGRGGLLERGFFVSISRSGLALLAADQAQQAGCQAQRRRDGWTSSRNAETRSPRVASERCWSQMG